MRTPSLPKGWKVVQWHSYMRTDNGPYPYYPFPSNHNTVSVILNPAGRVVMVLKPVWDNIYEYTEIETMTEDEFLKDYAWEPK